MCTSIENAPIFDKKVIDLYGCKSASDLESVSSFLASSSHKFWVGLNLGRCYIQDRGLYIIHKSLKGSGVIINKLWLWDNRLTQSSSSFVSDIVLTCKVQQLWISGNHSIGEGRELYTMLIHPSSMLLCLNLMNVKLSSDAARLLFAAVENANKLQTLSISLNDISDDVAPDIVTALMSNTSLHRLEMHNTSIFIGFAVQ